jgi:hypothetical protein
VRYFLKRPRLPLYRKWELIAELLDRLEEDYLKAYPDEPPVFEEGFKEALCKLVIP